ncbi:ABC transporter permease [Peribacillus sp. FSL H8-0477]|uniref:ABC transporter permease n=1 Tax=Peribacillus sp. FSL H8-0477 TaxID=2921388 RepID=UPI0030FCBFF0
MRGFFTLVNKEYLGIIRSKKIIWLPIVFMLMTLTQPLTLYYMEDILKMGGGLPEGSILQMPVPNAGEVMASVLSQLNTLGVLVIVVAVMSTISDERKSGSLTFILIRPVSSLQIVGSKTLAEGSIVVGSFICGYLLSYYYTVILFTTIPLHQVIESMLIYSLYCLFIVVCVIFSSALLTSNGAIAIVNILFFSVLSIASSLFSDFLKWSPAELSSHAMSKLINEPTNGLPGSIFVTIFLMILLLYAGARAVDQKRV